MKPLLTVHCIWILCLAILFSGCAAPDPTPVAYTATAAATRTPAPTNTPTPVPLPELDSGPAPQIVTQAEMDPRWQQLCEKHAGTPREGSMDNLELNSGVVLFKGVESSEWVFHDEEYPLVSYQDASRISYLVCILETSVYEFTYDNINIPAKRLIWDVSLVKLDSGALELTLHVEGPYPPTTTYVQGSPKVIYGDRPDLRLTDELNARWMFGEQERYITQDQVFVEWMRFSEDGQVLLVNNLVGKSKSPSMDEHLVDRIRNYHFAEMDFALYGEDYVDAAYSADLNGLMLTTRDKNGKLYLNYLTSEYGDLARQGQVNGRYFAISSRGECQGLECIPAPPGAGLIMRNGVCQYHLNRPSLVCESLLKGEAKQAVELALAGSADGRYFAAWQEGQLILWDAVQGVQVGELLAPASVQGEELPAPQVVFAPDGRYAAVRFSTGLWQLWSTQTLQPVANISRDVQIVFYPNGKKLALFSHQAQWIEVFDLDSLSLVEKIECGFSDLVWVVVSPQNDRIAAANLKMIRIFPAP